MNGLTGKRVAIAADRSAESIATLLKRFQAEPVSLPVQGSYLYQEEISQKNVLDYLQVSYEWVILTTGIGIRTLSETAEALGVKEELIKKLRRELLAIRGQKTVTWVKEHQLFPTMVSEKGTMEQLINRLPFGHGQSIFLQAYSEEEVKWKKRLEEKDYNVYVSKPYVFEPPREHNVEQLKREIEEGTVDAVVFTSKTQVKHLLPNVRNWHESVTPVAVGEVTASELERYDIPEVVYPASQKMGAMIVTLDEWYQTERGGEGIALSSNQQSF